MAELHPDLMTHSELKLEVRHLRAEAARLRALVLNIQSLAEKGFPIDAPKLATRCRESLSHPSEVTI